MTSSDSEIVISNLGTTYSNLKFRGAGAFGQVYRAEHKEHGIVALKFMWQGSIAGLQEVLRNQPSNSSHQSEDSEAATKRFNFEAAILKQLMEHTQSSKLLTGERGIYTPKFLHTDIGTVPKVPILVTEFVQAPFEDVSRMDNPLSEDDATWIIIRFLHLVKYIHENDIDGHKHYLLDAQLQNIRFDRKNRQLRVLDWNGVESLDDGKDKRGYANPAGHDIWWAMAFLFQMLTGVELTAQAARSDTELARRGGQCWGDISAPLKQLMRFLLPVPMGALPNDITAGWLIERLRDPSKIVAQDRPVNEQRMISLLDSLEKDLDGARIQMDSVDDKALPLKYLRRKLLLQSAYANSGIIRQGDLKTLLDVGDKAGVEDRDINSENLAGRFPNGEPPGFAHPYKLLRLELEIRDLFPKNKQLARGTVFTGDEIEALKTIKKKLNSEDWKGQFAYRDKLVLDLMKQEVLTTLGLGVIEYPPFIVFSNLVENIINAHKTDLEYSSKLAILNTKLELANLETIKNVIKDMGEHAQAGYGHDDLVEKFEEYLDRKTPIDPHLALEAAKQFHQNVKLWLIPAEHKEFLNQLSRHILAENLYDRIKTALAVPNRDELHRLHAEALEFKPSVWHPLFFKAFVEGITEKVDPDDQALESLIAFAEVFKSTVQGETLQKLDTWYELAQSIRSLDEERKKLENKELPAFVDDNTVTTCREITKEAEALQSTIEEIQKNIGGMSSKQIGKVKDIKEKIHAYIGKLPSRELLETCEAFIAPYNELKAVGVNKWSKEMENLVESVEDKYEKLKEEAGKYNLELEYKHVLEEAQKRISEHQKRNRTRTTVAAGIAGFVLVIVAILLVVSQEHNRVAVVQQTQVVLDRTNAIETKTQRAFQSNLTNTAHAQIATQVAATAQTGTAVAVASFTKTPTPTPTLTPSSTDTQTPTPTPTLTPTHSATPTMAPVSFMLQMPIFDSASKTYSTGVVAVVSERLVVRYRFRLLAGDGSKLDEQVTIPPTQETTLKVPVDRNLGDQAFVVEAIAEDAGGKALYRQRQAVSWIQTPTPTPTPTPIVSGVARVDQFTISAPDGKPLAFLVPDLEYGTSCQVKIWPLDNPNPESVGKEVFRNFLGIAGDSVEITVGSFDFEVTEKIEIALYHLKSDGTNSEMVFLSRYQQPIAFEVPISGYYNIGIRSAESGEINLRVIGKNVMMIDFVGKLDNTFNIVEQFDASNTAQRYRFFGADTDEIWLGYKIDPLPTGAQSIVLRLTNPDGKEQEYILSGSESELKLPKLIVTGYYTFAVDALAVVQDSAGFGEKIVVNLRLKAALLNTGMRFAQTKANEDQSAWNLPNGMPHTSNVVRYGFNSDLLRAISTLKAKAPESTDPEENQFIGSVAPNVSLLVYDSEVYLDSEGVYWRLVRDANTLRLKGWASSKFTFYLSRPIPAPQYSPTPKP
ncbi:hypothetical protein ANRL4_05434 [Anaerolineae bacterium]|nr:hypothetical protein ANRL4_05434 [Anaerolineae bacterium]